MADKVALITASSAGLGSVVAKLLAAASFRVVINYNSREEKAREIVQACESVSPSQTSGSPRFHIIKADATSRPDIQKLVSETIKVFGRLDVVVSNTGYTRFTNFMNIEEAMIEEDWDRCFNGNVKSHLWLFNAAKPHLEANSNGGNFVTIASTAGIKVSGSSLAYGVTKAAQIHLTKCLAVICGPKVRVNTVSPGLMLTEWGLQFPPERVQAMRDKSALKKIASVDDVADVVKTLCLNSSITGVNYVVDAGFTIT